MKLSVCVALFVFAVMAGSASCLLYYHQFGEREVYDKRIFTGVVQDVEYLSGAADFLGRGRNDRTIVTFDDGRSAIFRGLNTSLVRGRRNVIYVSFYRDDIRTGEISRVEVASAATAPKPADWTEKQERLREMMHPQSRSRAASGSS